MSFIGALLLRYCDEYEAFYCFTNLVMNHHFVPFCRGDVEEVSKQRSVTTASAIDKDTDNSLREAFQETDACSLSALPCAGPLCRPLSDAVARDTLRGVCSYLVLLYYSHVDVNLAGRVLDNFILDGEIFGLRFGLAILKYLEKELIKLPHNKILDLLMDMQGKLDE